MPWKATNDTYKWTSTVRERAYHFRFQFVDLLLLFGDFDVRCFDDDIFLLDLLVAFILEARSIHPTLDRRMCVYRLLVKQLVLCS